MHVSQLFSVTRGPVSTDTSTEFKRTCRYNSRRSGLRSSKGNSLAKVTDELQHLMDFNASISQAKAKTMEHLSDFVFVSMENLTYLSHLKSGIKPKTPAALRTAPL